jgi:predicted transglutaminase-like cysteine proteinase
MRTADRSARNTGFALWFAILLAAVAPARAEEVVVTAQVQPHLFGTVAIPGPAGRWGDRWHKVAGDLSGDAELARLVAPARGMDRLAQLAFVQAAVDRRIGWRSDGTQYGARTYWASASETLASGFGDDDDRAILKYQALRALGFPRGQFYLLMGRDRVRGDYVMLAARAADRWWLLEEQGNRLVAADTRVGFEPVASFGAGRTFVHGRPRRQLASGSAPNSIAGSSLGAAPR